MKHGLDKEEYDRSYSNIVLFKRVVLYFKSYRHYILIVATSVIMLSFAGAVIPFLLSLILDGLNNTTGEIQFIQSSNFYIYIILILAFYIIHFVLNAISTYFGTKSSQSVVFDIRQDVFNALLTHDLSFYDENSTGKLVSRVVTDSSHIGQTVLLFTILISQILTFVVVIGFLFYASLRLTVILIVFVPFIFIISLSLRKYIRKTSRASNRILEKINSLIQESTSGIYIGKSFRAEKQIYDKFQEYNYSSYHANLRRNLSINALFPILNVSSYLVIACLIYFSWVNNTSDVIDSIPLLNLISGEKITEGGLFLFLRALSLFFLPLIQIASFGSQIQLGLAGAERVFSLLDVENKVKQIGDIKDNNLEGEIEFRNISFEYKKGIKVLENFSLKIKAGEKVAIVGHTGAGKSTIHKLIGRYYEFQDGEILIGNRDIRTLNLKSYRSKIGIISQEIFLWNTSIRENILYGTSYKSTPENYKLNTNVDNSNVKSISQKVFEKVKKNSQFNESFKIIEVKLQKILKETEALDWINYLDEGINMQVGERGVRLSQGQKQLIACARVLMQNPKILLLDEATASVDPFTEWQIQKTLSLMMKNRTSIIIAHRLSTIQNADRIIVLKEGTVVEEGTHQNLMKKEGYYKELYEIYLKHQSLEHSDHKTKP